MSFPAALRARRVRSPSLRVSRGVGERSYSYNDGGRPPGRAVRRAAIPMPPPMQSRLRRHERRGVEPVAAGAIALVVTFALASLACGGDQPAAPRRPHVVLVVVDTLRADALGVLGSKHPTPRLDQLAAESVVFTTAIAASTWTLPSVATLMTSLHPSEHGLLGGGGGGEGQAEGTAGDGGDERLPQVLDDGLLTMAEAFQDGGYDTIGILNQVYLRWKFGFGQGFDYFEGLRGRDGFRINRRLEEVLDRGGIAGAVPLPGDRPLDGQGGEPGRLAAAAGAPLFVYLHYLDPHWPYTYRIEGEGEPLPPGLEAADRDPGLPRLPEAASDWVASQTDPELRRRGLDTLSSRYALEVQFVDAAIGGLVDLLEARGLWQDTLLVVTSDHGEGFWEHERLLHGHEPYEEQIRVPLLMRLPPSMGLAAGRRSEPVGLIDLMPTLLELAGLPIPAGCRGVSLVQAVRGEEDAGRALLVETGRERALRTRDGKLLLRRDREGESAEYYDLAADPGEQRNLATPCAGPCRESVRLLRELERGLAVGEPSIRSGGVTADEIEELRSLGYVGD
jgi:arylsulfatase A-like enzyme